MNAIFALRRHNHPRKARRTFFAAIAVVVGLLGTTARADHPEDNSFFQVGGANFMAFEAEAGHLADTGDASFWQRVEDPGDSPSEGFLLRPTVNFTGGAPASTSTFVLNFNDDSAPYHLYVRHKRFGGGSSDSLFTPDDFGEAPGFINRNGQLDGPEDVYNWWESPDVFDADAGAPQTFVMGSREGNMGVDRIVLSQQTGLSNAQLDALANSPNIPEPSSLLLAALGLLGLLGCGRRRRWR